MSKSSAKMNLNCVWGTVRKNFKNLIYEFEKRFLKTSGKESLTELDEQSYSDFLVVILLKKVNELVYKTMDINILLDFDIFSILGEKETMNFSKSPLSNRKVYTYFNTELNKIFLLESPDIMLDMIIEFLSIINENFESKNKTGTYFTPNLISEYIVTEIFSYYIPENEIDLNLINKSMQSITILDPAIGSGNFILNFIKYLNNSIISILDISPNVFQMDLFFDNYLDFINNNLFGFDIQNFSIKITKMRITLSILKVLVTQKSLQNNFQKIKRIKLKNIVVNDFLKGKIYNDRLFSIIVGNPPWGISIKESRTRLKENFTVSNKQFDSWSLFLEYGIKSLEKKGIIGFIVPSTILVNPNYATIREFILKETFIEEIINLGENFFPNINQPAVAIILRKLDQKKNDLRKTTKFITEINFNGSSDIHIMNKSFWKNQISFNDDLMSYWKDNEYFEFNILSNNLKKLVYNIENEKLKIKDIMTNGRGIEIGKKGRIIICPKCGKGHPPLHSKKRMKICSYCSNTIDKKTLERKIIFRCENDLNSDFKYKKVFLGEQILRFYSKKPYYIQIGIEGINYKSKTLFTGPKILLAKTGHGINAYIDEEDNYTLQVVYIFKVQLKKTISISEWAVLGILNSAIIHTFYYAKYGDINRKTFPHLIQLNILNLPFPKLNVKNEIYLKNIAKISRNLQKNYKILMELKEVTINFYNKITENEEISLSDFLLNNSLNVKAIKNLSNFLDKNIIFRSNIDFNIRDNQFLIIGYYFENKFIELIKISVDSHLYLLLIYILLKSQKNRFKLKKKSTLMILKEKIKIPEISKKNLTQFDHELKIAFKMEVSNQITELISIFSEIISDELQLNDFVLKIYEINDSGLLKSLIYPY